MIIIRKKTVMIWLFGIAALLALLSIFFQILKYFFNQEELFGLIEFFNIDSEKNLPTLFTVSLLLVVAILLFIIFKLHRSEKKKYSLYWIALSIIFIFLGIDENSFIHERFIEPLRELLNLSGIFYYAWVILGLLAVFIVFFLFLRFLLSIPYRIRIWFFLSGGIYIAGALIMEMIGGWYFEKHGLNFIYQLMVTFEESLEMSGLILFLRTLLEYLKSISSGQKDIIKIKIM